MESVNTEVVSSHHLCCFGGKSACVFGNTSAIKWTKIESGLAKFPSYVVAKLKKGS